ncbi:MAG: thioredoxin domain-containing protein [Nitrospirae bacterium]|nr:thioredoxin domain-containing protein [Nitrospirota bacterium]
MKNKTAIVCAFLFIISVWVILPFGPAEAGVSSGKNSKLQEELKEEVNALKKEVQELRKDVDAIKAKAVTAKPEEPQQETPEVTVSMDDDTVWGNSDAPVVVLEFSDYQCPFCKRYYKNTLSELDKDYIKTGKIKYVFRDFPLEFHKQAPKAAEAAQCAGEQGKYREMHDKIFDNQSTIQVDDLKKYALEIGLSADSFNSCLDSGKYTGEVNKDIDDGRKAGVSGTPTFFIGKAPLKGKEFTGQRIVGARPYSAFKQIIDTLLQAK